MLFNGKTGEKLFLSQTIKTILLFFLFRCECKLLQLFMRFMFVCCCVEALYVHHVSLYG